MSLQRANHRLRSLEFRPVMTIVDGVRDNGVGVARAVFVPMKPGGGKLQRRRVRPMGGLKSAPTRWLAGHKVVCVPNRSMALGMRARGVVFATALLAKVTLLRNVGFHLLADCHLRVGG